MQFAFSFAGFSLFVIFTHLYGFLFFLICCFSWIFANSKGIIRGNIKDFRGILGESTKAMEILPRGAYFGEFVTNADCNSLYKATFLINLQDTFNVLPEMSNLLQK